MAKISVESWESEGVSPDTVFAKIRPGMSIFLGTAVAEPRAMVLHLMTSAAGNSEAIQLFHKQLEELVNPLKDEGAWSGERTR